MKPTNPITERLSLLSAASAASWIAATGMTERIRTEARRIAAERRAAAEFLESFN